MLRSATRQRRRMRSLAALAVAAGRRAWRLLDPDVLDDTTRYVSTLLPVLESAQQNAADAGAAYVEAALEEQNIDAEPAGEVNTSALVGVAADGRSLASLLLEPIIRVKQAIGEGRTVPQAMQSGRSRLDTIMHTEVADAARAATGIGVVATPRVGYVRMLTLPSCARCVILAGRFYRYSSGFARHPNCFPAGVVVSGPQSAAASRRWFEGELVVLTTASGKNLPLTGNHPILTRRGWVPANLLEEGDEVVRSTRPEGATPLIVPDHHQVPSLIEDVWGALRVGGLERMPTTAEDFHGDGQNGEVDVVYADRTLLGGREPALAEHAVELGLARGIRFPGEFEREGAAVLPDLRYPAHSGGPVSGSGLRLPLLGGHLCRPDEASLAAVSTFNARLLEAARNDVTGDAVLPAERVFAGAAEISGHDFIDRQIASFPRWDAPGGAFSVETAEGYTSRGRDLLDRLSSQVELDRVIELRRVEWSGHVYSLTSAEGWHSANSLIVSNCDCIHIPSTEDTAGDLRTDPMAAFEADQIRGLSRAEQHAIRDGADINQVINARRGMYTAGHLRLTREGTTRRGIAGARLQGTARLMPEQIYREARSRDDAVRLLRQHGYLI